MKVKYDQGVDVLTIQLSSAPVEKSDEDKPGLFWTVTKTAISWGLRSSMPRSGSRIREPWNYAVA
jgi:hypothetical protein